MTGLTLDSTICYRLILPPAVGEIPAVAVENRIVCYGLILALDVGYAHSSSSQL